MILKTFNCEYCGKPHTQTKSHYDQYKKHFCSKVCSGLAHRTPYDETKHTNRLFHKNKITKGENNRIHIWIRDNYGKAKFCTFCDGKNAKRFEWALKKDRKYEKNIYNFFQLCISCHRKYYGNRNVPIIQLDSDGNFIKSYKSIRYASKANGILTTSISNNLSNKSKLAGGYKWRYENK